MKYKFSDLLFEKLEKLGLEPETTPERRMTGYIQRASGAWRWSCRNKQNREIGSADTMEDCVNSNHLTFHEDGQRITVCTN